MSRDTRENAIAKDKMEIWKDVPGWEDIYQVSNKGRVRSLDRFIFSSKWKHGFQHQTGKILKPGTHKKGYQIVSFTKPGTRKKMFWVHALVAQTFIGPRPEKLQVCHNDGNPKNNCVENLRYGTQKENSQDSIRHGTANTAKGADHPTAKLSWKQVRFLRANRPKKSIRGWSLYYRISPSTVCSIISGRAYVE